MDKGVDFSHYQRRADWLALKEVDGVKFAWFKMSEGDYFYDDHFDYYWEGAGREGIDRGPYHFFRRNISAEKQWDAIKGALPRYVMQFAIDVERHPADPRSLTAAQKDELRANLAGLCYLVVANLCVPTIYTGFYYWRDNVGMLLQVAGYPLWLASYRATPPPANLIPKPWADWTYWQQTASARLFGIDGTVDLDWRR